jgi:stage II sporulation protein D
LFRILLTARQASLWAERAGHARILGTSAIPSLQFTPRLSGSELILEGHGHGVGLCQWGARGMAQAGSGPLAILRHYYPGVEVVRVR